MTTTITIGWTDNDGLEPTGKLIRFDGVNYKEEYRAVIRAKAVVWLNKGGPQDLENAKRYTQTDMTDRENVKVFQFSISEPDPLGKTKAAILEEVQS